MPRMASRRRQLTIAAAAFAALALPASAQAASTFTVSTGGGACGATDVTCGTIGDAAGAAVSGDTISISPGTYNENVTFAQGGVTVLGQTTGTGAVVTGSL